MKPKTLITDRLVLSVPTASDAEGIFRACQDPTIQHFTTVPSPYRREHAEGFIASAQSGWSLGSELTWAVRRQDALVGMIGLLRPMGHEAELGYWVSADHRRKGYIVEAGKAVLGWAFETEGGNLERIQWRAQVGNIASAKTAQSLGFHFEGTQAGAVLNGRGERFDGWIAGRLRSDSGAPEPWPIF